MLQVDNRKVAAWIGLTHLSTGFRGTGDDVEDVFDCMQRNAAVQAKAQIYVTIKCTKHDALMKHNKYD